LPDIARQFAFGWDNAEGMTGNDSIDAATLQSICWEVREVLIASNQVVPRTRSGGALLEDLSTPKHKRPCVEGETVPDVTPMPTRGPFLPIESNVRLQPCNFLPGSLTIQALRLVSIEELAAIEYLVRQ
jgi:hypothetical protein